MTAVRRAMGVVLVGFALAALLLGAALWVHGSLLRRDVFPATEVPLALQAGARAETGFRASGRFRQQFWLVLRRGGSVSDEALDEALLAGPNGPPDISWEVFSSAGLYASGRSTHQPRAFAGMQGSRGRLLGEFTPPGSGRYRLALVVNRSQPGLEGAQPVVRIRPPASQAKSAGIAATVYETLGLILLCLGILLALIYPLSARRRT